MGAGFNRPVNISWIQADGKILLGGYFEEYNGEQIKSIVRLNTDGTRDSTFNIGTGFNDGVNTLALQSDGKIIVGGWFSSYQGVLANRIIRLNSNGSIDMSFNIGTGFDNSVWSITKQTDGKILVGGQFYSYKGVEVDSTIRLNSDGSHDSDFNVDIGFNNYVSAITQQSDGKILAIGDFSNYNGVPQSQVVVLLNSDGSMYSRLNMGSGFDGGIITLAMSSDEKILAGGLFSTYKGDLVNNIVRLNSDGSRDNTFEMGTGFNNSVYTIVQHFDGKIIVGGLFDQYDGEEVNRIIRLNSDGSRDSSFNIGTGFNFDVYTIDQQSDGKIIVGGWFNEYNGESVNGIARLNTDGTLDSTFDTGTGFNGSVNTLALQPNGKIIVGGWFDEYNGETIGYGIARLNTDGTLDSTFDPGTGFNGYIHTITQQSDGKIIVGGDFNQYNGEEANRIIRLNSDGSRDNTFEMGAGFNNYIYTINQQSDGKIIVGGDFNQYNGEDANRIIRLNSDGSRDMSFNIGTGFNSYVYNIIQQTDGKILVSGEFFKYQNTSAGYLIRIYN